MREILDRGWMLWIRYLVFISSTAQKNNKEENGVSLDQIETQKSQI